MSQSDDMGALDTYFKANAAKAGAAIEVASWRQWFDGLSWLDKCCSDDVLVQAKARRDRLNSAIGAPDLVALGYKLADHQDPIDVSKEFAGGGAPPTLSMGSSGAAVVKLQNAIGAKPADGKFGSGTKAALIKFQVANGLPGDGVAGPLTWAKINVKTVSDITKPPPNLPGLTTVTPPKVTPVPPGYKAPTPVVAVPPGYAAPPGVAIVKPKAATPVVSASILSTFTNLSTPVKVIAGCLGAAVVAMFAVPKEKGQGGALHRR